jgi:hypothetical protein
MDKVHAAKPRTAYPYVLTYANVWSGSKSRESGTGCAYNFEYDSGFGGAEHIIAFLSERKNSR